MPPTPQALRSNTVNPANLLELQVLTSVVTQLQEKNDIRGSVPYLAKIAQIIDNQKITKPLHNEGPLDNYYQQLNQLRKIQADSHAQLADAYFKTQQFVLCENTLLSSVKIWEKLVQHTNEDFSIPLQGAYEQLKACYETMGKTQLAQHVDTKLSKLVKSNVIGKWNRQPNYWFVNEFKVLFYTPPRTGFLEEIPPTAKDIPHFDRIWLDFEGEFLRSLFVSGTIEVGKHKDLLPKQAIIFQLSISGLWLLSTQRSSLKKKTKEAKTE